MVDAQRALLDELMGVSRDGDREKVRRKFTDPDICHHYLCGMCPFEEFERTKHDVGPCPLLHDEDLKADWEKLDDKSKERLGFERELYKYLDKLMLELASKIRRNTDRLAAEEAAPLPPGDQHAKKLLDDMADELQELLTRSEVLGEQGDVDGSQAAAAQAEAVKARRAKAEEDLRNGIGGNRYGMQEVCPLSGVIINKEESRIRDHKNGRNYRAWCLTHEKYKELKETFKRRDGERLGGGAEKPSAERSRERDRDRDRERGRDRDRGRERERPRGKDDDRDRRKRERDEQFEHRDGRNRDRDWKRDGRQNGH